MHCNQFFRFDISFEHNALKNAFVTLRESAYVRLQKIEILQLCISFPFKFPQQAALYFFSWAHN